jgi:hypothetical protein
MPFREFVVSFRGLNANHRADNFNLCICMPLVAKLRQMLGGFVYLPGAVFRYAPAHRISLQAVAVGWIPISEAEAVAGHIQPHYVVLAARYVYANLTRVLAGRKLSGNSRLRRLSSDRIRR